MIDKKPCYCLGANTIKRVADEGQLQTDHVDFVAASDLFQANPYKIIEQLKSERDQLRSRITQLENELLR